MIVDWLNGSLIFRAENTEEQHSLAVMLQGISKHNRLEETQISVEPEETISQTIS